MDDSARVPRMLTMREPPFVQGRPLVGMAVEWARQLHARQRRDVDQAPFVLHPLEVASLLSSLGFDQEVVAAGVLHDSVEKTEAGVNDVRERFGDRVARIVAAVSEDPSIADDGARREALARQVTAGGPDAHAVYAADKVTKVRELRARATRDSPDDPHVQLRLEHYEHSLATLRAVSPGQPLVEKLAFELWALQALPPYGDD
jgi:(p)ppGpp synthase/HD superfamily hydrolase